LQTPKSIDEFDGSVNSKKYLAVVTRENMQPFDPRYESHVKWTTWKIMSSVSPVLVVVGVELTYVTQTVRVGGA